MSRRLIIGCGNESRGDDAAGVLVARQLRAAGLEAVEHRGDGLALLELWSAGDDVVLVDAVRSGGNAGDIIEWDALTRPVGVETVRITTHVFGTGEGVELARVLGRLPASLLVYGIEAAQFEEGTTPGAEVRAAIERVVERIRALPA